MGARSCFKAGVDCTLQVASSDDQNHDGLPLTNLNDPHKPIDPWHRDGSVPFIQPLLNAQALWSTLTPRSTRPASRASKPSRFRCSRRRFSGRCRFWPAGQPHEQHRRLREVPTASPPGGPVFAVAWQEVLTTPDADWRDLLARGDDGDEDWRAAVGSPHRRSSWRRPRSGPSGSTATCASISSPTFRTSPRSAHCRISAG